MSKKREKTAQKERFPLIREPLLYGKQGYFPV